jgi:hypothetical protein
MQNIFFILLYNVMFFKDCTSRFLFCSQFGDEKLLYVFIFIFCASKTEEIRNKYKNIESLRYNILINMASTSDKEIPENIPTNNPSGNQASSDEAQRLTGQATDPADSNSDGSKKGV